MTNACIMHAFVTQNRRFWPKPLKFNFFKKIKDPSRSSPSFYWGFGVLTETCTIPYVFPKRRQYSLIFDSFQLPKTSQNLQKI